ncbi:unnamed protein product, partial [Urochloa humidicola]
QTVAATSSEISTSRLLIQHPHTSLSIPSTSITQTSQESPDTPHTIQPEATDTPPLDLDIPDDSSARKRLFSTNIDEKKETDADSAKRTKLDQSASGTKEHCQNPTSPERSPPENQMNLPPEDHHSTKKMHYLKKR